MRRIAFGIVVFLIAIQSLYAQERVLKSEIVIRSTVEKAWWAMTTEDGMKAWNVHDAQVEMKVMGKYHSHYSGKVGDPGTVTNTILSFIPNRMFSFKLGFPDTFMVPDAGKRVPVPEVIKAGTIFAVVEFEDIGMGNIRASVTMPGYRSGHEWDLVYDFFKKGNDTDLQALKKFLEAR